MVCSDHLQAEEVAKRNVDFIGYQMGNNTRLCSHKRTDRKSGNWWSNNSWSAYVSLRQWLVLSCDEWYSEFSSSFATYSFWTAFPTWHSVHSHIDIYIGAADEVYWEKALCIWRGPKLWLLLDFIYFFGGLFYVTVSIQTVQHQIVGWLMNWKDFSRMIYEWERIWKEVVIVSSRWYASICLEGLWKTMKTAAW
jgi:hypothetical protein